MITVQSFIKYICAEPFRPFQIRLATGESLDINYPDMIAVGRSKARISWFLSDDPARVKEGEREVPLLSMESIEPLRSSVMHDEAHN